MRNSHVDKRSNRYAARQFVSDIEIEGVPMSNVSEPLQRCTGVIKFFNETKGFGFARRDNDTDVFVHVNELKRSGINTLPQTGDKLEFDVSPVEGKGPKAVSIRLLGNA